MKLCSWKPKQQDVMSEFFNLDHPFFGASSFPTLGGGTEWCPALDITEDEKHIHVKADLPGLKKEDIHLSVDGTVLTIKGTRQYEDETKKKNFHRIERAYGSFQRSVDLGIHVEAHEIKAKYKDGVLELSAPKTERAQKQKIHIE